MLPPVSRTITLASSGLSLHTQSKSELTVMRMKQIHQMGAPTGPKALRTVSFFAHKEP